MKKAMKGKRKETIAVMAILALYVVTCLSFLSGCNSKIAPSVSYGFYNKDKKAEITLGMAKSDIDEKLGVGELNTKAKTENTYMYDSVELIVKYDSNEKAISLLANSDGSNNTYSHWYAYNGVASEMTVDKMSDLLGDNADYTDMGVMVAFTKDGKPTQDISSAAYELTVLLSSGKSEQLLLDVCDE